jgi:hypothetical protein
MNERFDFEESRAALVKLSAEIDAAEASLAQTARQTHVGRKS